MKPLYRSGVHKGSSAGAFRHDVGHTKSINLVRPMRGGWRL